mmetsp:Transcript_8030/g.7589  ORF Transcript_8030/g.7589 Transcript_8030/m.7589 type:complete len:140 (-) Transcript_8030:691-1110(-)
MWATYSATSSELIKERVRCFKYFLSLLASHASFSKSDEVRLFLTQQKEFEEHRAKLTQLKDEEKKKKNNAEGTGSGILSNFPDSFKSAANSLASTVASTSKELVKSIYGANSDEIEGLEKLDYIEKVLQTLRNAVEELK